MSAPRTQPQASSLYAPCTTYPAPTHTQPVPHPSHASPLLSVQLVELHGLLQLMRLLDEDTTALEEKVRTLTEEHRTRYEELQHAQTK